MRRQNRVLASVENIVKAKDMPVGSFGVVTGDSLIGRTIMFRAYETLVCLEDGRVWTIYGSSEGPSIHVKLLDRVVLEKAVEVEDDD